MEFRRGSGQGVKWSQRRRQCKSEVFGYLLTSSLNSTAESDPKGLRSRWAVGAMRAGAEVSLRTWARRDGAVLSQEND